MAQKLRMASKIKVIRQEHDEWLVECFHRDESCQELLSKSAIEVTYCPSVILFLEFVPSSARPDRSLLSVNWTSEKAGFGTYMHHYWTHFWASSLQICQVSFLFTMSQTTYKPRVNKRLFHFKKWLFKQFYVCGTTRATSTVKKSDDYTSALSNILMRQNHKENNSTIWLRPWVSQPFQQHIIHFSRFSWGDWWQNR